MPGVDLYEFPARSGSVVRVLWSHDGDAHDVPVERGAKVLDVFGNAMPAGPAVTATVEPVYVIAPSK